MDVRALGYIGLEVADPAAWTDYVEALGAMVVGSPADGPLAVRIDERPHRVIIETEANLVVGFDTVKFAQFTNEAIAAGMAD